jgi:DNA-directed RNA polymerase subunit L
MNPVISELQEDDNYLKFKISNINVSLANAIRRIILSEIPCIVIRTMPYEKNDATFHKNTTRMNNELIKQRLSCIPIHITDTDFPIDDHIVEINKKNNTDSINFITTEDFKIKNIKTDTYLTSAVTKQIFPPNNITGDYIILARLRPEVSNEIEGEELSISCKLSIGNAKEDSSFNVACTACYSAAQDSVKINEVWAKKYKELQSKGLPSEEIENIKKDWLLLDAKRIILPDTFNFTIETVGVFSNMSIVFKACDILVSKLKNLQEKIQANPELITTAETTINNCFDIKLPGENHTLGKVIEYILYSKHYNKKTSDKTLSYCGFQKPHPHIDESLIRLGFYNSIDKTEIINYISNATDDAINIFKKIGSEFRND